MGSFTTSRDFLTSQGTTTLDPRMEDILRAAAALSGFDIVATSGVAERSHGTKNHLTGHAVDIALVDPKTGKQLPAYQNAVTFSQYEQFAQIARIVQQQKYPELDGTFRWGGYFNGNDEQGIGPHHYGAVDLMHFDDSPWMNGATGLGDWKTGANLQLLDAYPGAKTNGGFGANPDLASSIREQYLQLGGVGNAEGVSNSANSSDESPNESGAAPPPVFPRQDQDRLPRRGAELFPSRDAFFSNANTL